MIGMRVLHVWDIAGVGSVIAKYMHKMPNVESWVITRARFDRFGCTAFGERMNCRAEAFTLKALWMARKYDLIHVHDFDKFVPLLKRFYPSKPVILHYHGTRIRGKADGRRRYYQKADFVIVSTPDLLEDSPEATYIPNPVDTEFFQPLRDHSDNSAIYIIKHQEELGETLEWPKSVAQKYGLKLSFRDRIENPIPYKELPMFLNQYSYFVDRDYVKSLSKTALEALACGCRVIRWDGQVIGSLPLEHYPTVVVEKILKIYESLTEVKERSQVELLGKTLANLAKI